MRKSTKSEQMRALGALGLKKRYHERMRLIEELRSFGGEQPNYRKWSTEHLKTLLRIWQGKKN